MDAPERSSGQFGTFILRAGQTYDTVADPSLPEVFEFIVTNAGGTVTELIQSDDQDLDETFANGGHLAGAALAGEIGVNAPVTVEDGNLLKKIVSGTAILHLYTVKVPKIQ